MLMLSKSFVATTVLLLFGFTMSCGGGGKASDTGGLVGFTTGASQAGAVPSDGTTVGAPQVTAVQITNNPAKNGDPLHVNVSFNDAQGDVATVNVGIAGQSTYSAISVIDVGVQTSGTLFLNLTPSSNSPGTYTMFVSITDSAGHTSLAISQTFTILNPDGTMPGGTLPGVAADASADVPGVRPLDGGVVPVSPDSGSVVTRPDTGASSGRWELVQTDVFDKLAATDTNYSVKIVGSSISCSWSMNADVMAFTASWSAPPAQILPTDKLPMSLSVKMDQNAGTQYSANGVFDVWFDKPDCEPGSIISPIGLKGAQGETGSFTISHLTGAVSPPVQVFINGKDLPAGSVGARMALMVVAGNGRNFGVRYVYAWKTP
jgi:hypothetical protein